MSITGRSIAERPEVIYNPLSDWIRLHLSRFTKLRVVIFLEYINSGSSKALRDVLRMISEYRAPQFRIKITWLYEEDDESMHELGEHYRDAAGVNMDVQMVL
ncbi:MAG: SiaC family regulatory phosphoprotein [Bacteroidales bacterium]|nr:SiaC family regulatory phosphoprotein [Bacteroidales bacterium]